MWVEAGRSGLWYTSLFVQAVALVAGGAFWAKSEVTTHFTRVETCLSWIEIFFAIIALERPVGLLQGELVTVEARNRLFVLMCTWWSSVLPVAARETIVEVAVLST